MTIKDQKPDLFQKSACNIWTDPYIQQQMLRAHLDQSSDRASRRMDSIRKTVALIKNNVQPGSHILDLGCGPGLYARMLREAEYRVTGVDFNKASIEYAVSCQDDIEYIQGDYITDYPKGCFDAAMMIYCDMGTHPDSERDELLGKIYQSFRGGGTLIFDLFTEKLAEEKKEGKDWEHAPSGGFWSEHESLLLSQTFHYPQANCFAYQYNLLTDGQTKHFIVWDRYYCEKEIHDLLKKIGFSEVQILKNVLSDNNFTSGSEMFVVAVK